MKLHGKVESVGQTTTKKKPTEKEIWTKYLTNCNSPTPFAHPLVLTGGVLITTNGSTLISVVN